MGSYTEKKEGRKNKIVKEDTKVTRNQHKEEIKR
jgi:hypothetical protein